MLSFGYRSEPGRFDELVDELGRVRPHWEALLANWDDLGQPEIARRQTVAERLLVAAGASYTNAADGGHGTPISATGQGTWRLDPIPYVLTSQDWVHVEAGLRQRAQLLDLVLADLYGPRTLLLDGTIPIGAALSAQAYLFEAIGVEILGPRLVTYAADLVRDAQGQFLVVRDHTDVPVAAGYAHLNRSVVTRLFPDALKSLTIQPLDPWFVDLRRSFESLAPRASMSPRTIVLAPAPTDADYVEASYLSTLLGYHLAQSDDLAVRSGRVWLRALEGLEGVDVIFRRISDNGVDSLQAPGRARQTGVPGLIQAVREQHVSVANSIGSGVANGVWMQPFLGQICERLLGDPLLLPAIETLWCGDPEHLGAVQADIGSFVIHDTDPRAPRAAVFGSELSDVDQARWRARISAAPNRYVAQRKIRFASTPVVSNGSVHLGMATIRMQAVNVDNTWVVLPGGHGRQVLPDRPVIDAFDTNADNTLGKDVWVMGGVNQQLVFTHAPSEASVSVTQLPQVDLSGSLPTRAAEALFWLGRNAEHAEMAARFTRSVIGRAEQQPGLVDTAWGDLARAGLAALTGGDNNPFESVTVAISGALGIRSGSVYDAISNLTATANTVREFLSQGTWRLVNALEREKISFSATLLDIDTFETADALDRVEINLLALSGLSLESVVRGPSWRFLDLGRRFERALTTLGLLEATLGSPPPFEVVQDVYALVLAGCESLVAYRRKFRSDVRIEALGEFLVNEPSNPRSIRFQLDRIAEHLASLPWPQGAPSLSALLDQASLGITADLENSTIADRVLAIRGPLLQMVDELLVTWFTHPPHRHV